MNLFPRVIGNKSKNKQTGLNWNEKHFAEQRKPSQNEKRAYGWEKYLQMIWLTKGLIFHYMQTAHAAQYQKSKQSNQKWT